VEPAQGWVISKHPAHPALVSEADFIAAQDAAAPRGPAGPAARRYLLAGLLACGRCRRRLESAWSNGKPAYRCRHGYTSATRPGHGRTRNTYIREDQILPHLAALAILAADGGTPDDGRTVQVRTPSRGSQVGSHQRPTSSHARPAAPFDSLIYEALSNNQLHRPTAGVSFASRWSWTAMTSRLAVPMARVSSTPLLSCRCCWWPVVVRPR